MYYITWYDEERRGNRRLSTRTNDIGEAISALDRQYNKDNSEQYCPTCGQELRKKLSPKVADAIADYLAAKEESPSIVSINARLSHVLDYMLTIPNGKELRCTQIDERWIKDFRRWLDARPIITPSGKHKKRAPSTVENSVLQLAAAINFADPARARFSAEQASEVNRTPTFRLSLDQLVAIFGYAVQGKRRASLLNFIRLSVITLGRPDAVLEASTARDRGQWDRGNALFNLNPIGRRQTNKRRAIVPVARQAIDWLNSIDGSIVKATTVKTAWRLMMEQLGIDEGEGELGTKLLRRSMADMMRMRMDASHWPEIEVFLGHEVMNSTSVLYAPTRPDYLAHAKGAIESIIDEIEAVVPGCFSTSVAPVGRIAASKKAA
ncbi:phage integrase SAM-like domain-containing protein [Sphingomonas sp.]|uniref:phage integrase SAM-like domain-containing protein n=1 Tax=Sphingomonas sp. TaxID=28214 RepID=UPI00257A8DD2|nr:phage integrase SAM-like domain-containing protein [Sphingomonas sp.]